ncbi:DNA replication and repair protein RadC [Saccharicrinis carchari]|uniref:DNA replication and repair protein RadC n=1 Tax=Saccharicrinis carchari TaxID=1168039 RepID=A0A521CEF8_SACCC|nr:DNA repair protein RadC [Saccharicrinis carchari]SMO57808.1 DNA replication and repair protein RadC [Saccharicrinis carchari]
MTYHKLSIKKWALEDRPREKMISKGISSLSNAELIAILIGSGNRDESAVDVSKRILNDVDNNLNELGKLSIEKLRRDYRGIGEAKAICIVAAMELGRRRKLEQAKEKPKITNSSDVYDLMHPLLADLPHEEFWILLLNRANKVMSIQKISQGGVAGTVMDSKIIMRAAIDQLASSIILCHNHPSGNIMPSRQDKNITQKLKEAGSTMDIPILDHIIVTDAGFYSFADEGDL